MLVIGMLTVGGLIAGAVVGGLVPSNRDTETESQYNTRRAITIASSLGGGIVGFIAAEFLLRRQKNDWLGRPRR
jgi:hypothetical protein